jgi:hypothetical protein
MGIYERAITQLPNGITVSSRRSAASEGVLAALRLSKSTQSADKVHFSDSSELLRREFQNSAPPYQLVAVTNDQFSSGSVKSVRYLSQTIEMLDRNRVF